ncbi:MAG: preprotein translocase subunit SecG [Gammaproteobacteria bacterium RIFCSPHIGHO2_12_FULL_40_19]|nr:MAG: preprotein translocase subunit SecG [Gammaproteobacteria bacterium RIFCSPHIGHO2_12_FULL_40_19]
MQQLILILHVLVAMAIIALVLMQHGRGADVGAAFGSGSSNTMFGSAGALPFLMKVTAICAAIFFTTSLSLSYMAARGEHKTQILNMPSVPTAPVTSTQKNNALPASSSDAGFSFAPSAPDKTDNATGAKK